MARIAAKRHPGKRVDDLAPLLESGGHGPRDADERVVGLGDVLRGKPVASSSWSRSDSSGSITRNVIAVVPLSRELGKRPSVFVIGRASSIPGRSGSSPERRPPPVRRRVPGPVADRPSGSRWTTAIWLVSGTEKSLCVCAVVSRDSESFGSRLVAGRLPASSRLGRNTPAPMAAAVQPTTITQRRRTTVHANARANAVRLMRSGRVLCEDEVTGRARRRR